MNKILMLLQSEFPPDIRLEKEIKSLSAAGYSVSLMANCYSAENSSKTFPNVDIYRLSAPYKKKSFNKILNFPLFFNPKFVQLGKKLCREIKPAFIHAHDLPMLPLGLKLGKKFNIPVIFDMHENYPEALKYFDKKGLVNLLFKNYRLAKYLERKTVPKADKIIVVVDESKNRLISEGIPQDKVHVVSNTVDPDFYSAQTKFNEISDFKNKFVILYTGTISPERGLDTPVKALQMINKEIQNVHMLFVGAGPSLDELKNLAINTGVTENVSFVGWQPHNKLKEYLQVANVAMIPQPSNDFIDTTIPHKLFEYMSQGKPVIVSDAKPLKRIITETEAGEVFRSADPESFADTIKVIYESDKNYGRNGIEAVKNKYNWDVDSGELLKLYQDLRENKFAK